MYISSLNTEYSYFSHLSFVRGLYQDCSWRCLCCIQAYINEDSSGDVNALRREIQQLKEQIYQLKTHGGSAMPSSGSDHHNLSAMSPTLGYSSNNLLHKVTKGVTSMNFLRLLVQVCYDIGLDVVQMLMWVILLVFVDSGSGIYALSCVEKGATCPIYC